MNILIVEDEAGISNFLKQGLEEEGYGVYVATDGQEGMDMAVNNEFDLIILDWMLPYYSGREICLRVREKNIQTPIIFLTAKDTVSDTVEGLEAGANDYIKKPFSFEELLSRIKVQLRYKSENSLKFKELVIDVKSHLVTFRGKDIHLTKKEFDLLAFLAKNKNNVCKREDIIKQVWDIHFEYDTGVIDVYINSLRKKIRKEGGEEIIKTVRGVGYIFRES